MVMFKEQDAPLTAIIAALCLGTISGTAIAQASHLPEDVPAQKLQLESKPPPRTVHANPAGNCST